VSTIPQKRTKDDDDSTKSEAESAEKTKKHCRTCGVECASLFYTTSTTSGDASPSSVEICKNCFLDGRFPSNLYSGDFMRVEQRATHHADEAPWSDQETLLLLEGLEMYDDDWTKISEHVGTRTRDQCILKFLDLPIEDPFAEIGQEKLGPLQYYDVPFSGVDNPILSVVAMLASIVPHDIAKAASAAAVGEVTRKKLKLASDNDGKSSDMAVDGGEKKVGDEEDSKGNEKAGETAKKEEHEEKVDGMDVDDQPPTAMVKTEEGGEEKAEASSSTANDKAAIEEKANVVGETATAAIESVPETKGKPLTTIEKAGAIALGAAAAKASSIAASETKEARRITNKVIELQIQKLELKMKLFEEIEAVIDAERAEVDRERKLLAMERANLKKERGNFLALKASINAATAAAGATAASAAMLAQVMAPSSELPSRANFPSAMEVQVKAGDRPEQTGLAVMSVG
jgi:SWI/SNF related-matrix-associated actin-dependent regulator of chromatin subfamily C